MSLPRKPEAFPLSEYEISNKNAGLYHGINRYQNAYYNYYTYLPSSSSLNDHDHYLAFSEQTEIATFEGCFKNPFIYCFFSGMTPGFREQFDEIIHRGSLNEETKELKLKKLYDSLDCWRQQVLYATIDSILDVGEFAEILTVFINHMDFIFGPPISERTISLKDLLNLKNVLHHPKYPDIRGGYKLTIIKIE